ncbi:uncharacterized protein VTP21DRAFT_6672 [Calcarisporiella thermophila]|uniref:uncharacterized protein n=1 Tax=Calcarisporiella thermophila TaxID=911321 RepID=UPI0037445894
MEIDTKFEIKLNECERLLKEYQGTKLHAEELRDEFFQKSAGREEYDKNSDIIGLHPKSIDTDLRYFKEHFSKLKFNYLEQETKEKFLRAILEPEPPLVIEPSDNKELEERNKEQKQLLKNSKLHSEALRKSISEVADTVSNEHAQLAEKMALFQRMLREVDQMESDLQNIRKQLDSKSKLTVEETRVILEEQMNELMKINESLDERKPRIADLKWELETMEKEMNLLEADKKIAKTLAAEAIRISKQRDPTVEERYKRVKATVECFRANYGVRQIERTSKDEITVHFISPLENPVSLRVTYSRQKLVNAQIFGVSCNIRDVLEHAVKRNDISYLFYEISNRLKAENLIS